MRLAASLIVLSLSVASPAWALLPCPAAARDVPLSGTSVGWAYGGTPQVHHLQMHPCEEFWIDVTASSGDPFVNTPFYVDVYNTPGTKIDTKNWGLVWWASPSVSETNVLPPASVGFPLAGTRDSRSLVARIEVLSDYAKPAYPIAYTVTVHFRPRPGYNYGGLSYADAFGPLAHGTVLKASMWAAEVNYYRVSLLPGGVLKLSGSLTNENWGVGAHLAITVRNMAQHWQASLLSQTVPNNASHDPNGVTVNFTSPTFTNTSGQTQNFYLVFENANSARFQDITINVAGDLVPPPQLTLFLDADNDLFLDGEGNVSAIPVSDHPKYVPGAILATSVSVSSLPQSLKLVAAYTNANGQVVAPPSWAQSVTFTLSGTSAFKGSAMNVGSETTPDFDLGTCVHPAAGGGCAFDTSDHTARISLACRTTAAIRRVPPLLRLERYRRCACRMIRAT